MQHGIRWFIIMYVDKGSCAIGISIQIERSMHNF